jgi:hypothetical protein
MPYRILTQQTTTKQGHPQCVRAQNAAQTLAVLPRSSRIPHQTIVAEGNKKQTVHIMAGAHMGSSKQALPQVQRDHRMPRTQNKKRTMINKEDSGKR